MKTILKYSVVALFLVGCIALVEAASQNRFAGRYGGSATGVLMDFQFTIDSNGNLSGSATERNGEMVSLYGWVSSSGAVRGYYYEISGPMGPGSFYDEGDFRGSISGTTFFGLYRDERLSRVGFLRGKKILLRA